MRHSEKREGGLARVPALHERAEDDRADLGIGHDAAGGLGADGRESVAPIAAIDHAVAAVDKDLVELAIGAERLAQRFKFFAVFRPHGDVGEERMIGQTGGIEQEGFDGFSHEKDVRV